MAHELEMTAAGAGNMIYVGELPWHRLGTRFASPPTIAETIAAIGADRVVEKVPVFLADGQRVPAAFATTHTDVMGKVHVLGAVGARYTVCQDDVALRALAPLVDSGAATIETAGYLCGGRKMFATLRFASGDMTADVVSGDPVQAYAMLAHAHDGSLSIHCGVTTTRIVCANTLAGSIGSDGASMIKLRHTRGASDAIGDIATLIASEREAFHGRVTAYRHLASKTMTRAQFRDFAKLVFPYTGKKTDSDRPVAPAVEAVWSPPVGMSALDALMGDAASTVTTAAARADRDARSIDILAEVRAAQGTDEARSIDILAELFESGRGADMAGVRGTAWGAYNAVTEYLTHHKGRSDESRLLATQLGADAKLASSALATLLA